jgi:hypothetical protein
MFGGSGKAPDLPIDADVLSEEELHKYVASLQASGCFGPNSWYMNHERNIAYAAKAVAGGRLPLPVLFLQGECG